MGIRTELAKINEKLTDISPTIDIEYYISPEGNNSNNGKRLSSAFKTLEKGIDVINNFSPDLSVALWIAPGVYYERSGILLEADLNLISAIQGIPGTINIIGSGISGELTEADSNLFEIEGRRNLIKGLTLFCNSSNFLSLSCKDKSGVGGRGSFNSIENCNFYFGDTTDEQKYGLGIIGSQKVKVKKCFFGGANTAGIFILKNIDTPTDIIIEDCDFIGTNRGIIIDGDNFNILVRRNYFSAGSRLNEAMANAIEIKASMTAGKITAYDNHFEQSGINDILDNKVGGTLIEMNNFNGA
jgi:hypothetical protein